LLLHSVKEAAKEVSVKTSDGVMTVQHNIGRLVVPFGVPAERADKRFQIMCGFKPDVIFHNAHTHFCSGHEASSLDSFV
jgi:hypothetical protein